MWYTMKGTNCMEDGNEKTCPFCQLFHKVQENDAYCIDKRDERTGENQGRLQCYTV